MFKKSQDVVKFIFIILISLVFVLYIVLYNVDRSVLIGLVHNSTSKLNELSNGTYLPWYFQNGKIRPTVENETKIWPGETREDRIINQLMYMPKQISTDLKKIYLFDRYSFKVDLGRKIFMDSKCPVEQCVITDDKATADALVFRNEVTMKRNAKTPPNQVRKSSWVFF